jgi:ABC-type nickel/cobalt efflux system permease component RcnA
MTPLALATSFFLGLRHCFEPDHLAAVAQFASGARTPREGLRAGLLWGLGHGLSVVAFGVVFAALWSRIGWLSDHAEQAAGLALVGLSAWRLWSTLRAAHDHEHRHADGTVHAHPHCHDVEHWHAPTLLGLVHGAAGAVSVAFVLSALGGNLALGALAFSLGAVLAMGSAGWLAARAYRGLPSARHRRAAVVLTSFIGLAIGAMWLTTA